MDPWQTYALNHPSVSNREENELLFNQYFHNDPNLQVPMGDQANASFGSFSGSFSSSYGSYGSINQFLSNHSAPSAPSGFPGSFPGSQQMARLESRHSLDYALSVGSTSPFQDPFNPPSADPSPLLMPQAANNMLFPELDLSNTNAVPNNSFEDETSPLSASSAGSANWNYAPPFPANMATHHSNVNYFNSMSQQELNDFFGSEMFLDSLQSTSQQTSPNTSPAIQPQGRSAPMPISNIPDLRLGERGMQLSPHSNSPALGIIEVGMNRDTGTMGPQRNSSGAGRRAPGRRGPLDPITRRKAAAMRGHACESCRRRKASCDRGIPCRSCIRHYGVRLLQSPCRGKLLNSLADGFLKGPIFPGSRGLESFLGSAPGSYSFSGKDCSIKLKFGFGDSLAFPMKIVMPADRKNKLVHNHIVYQWPPQANEVTAKCRCQHHVFPAVIADTSNLKAVLDHHLGVLVDNHFDEFPAYESVLRVLRPIYTFYRRLPEGEPQQLLRQALKLLTLVHIGGDTQVCPRDPMGRLIATKAFGRSALGERPLFPTCPSNLGSLPTPCFIRGQLGEFMPLLAQDLMTDVLSRLEFISLGRECNMWAPVLATFAVFVMAVESIEYHTEKVAFHAAEATPTPTQPRAFGPSVPAERSVQTTISTPSPMEQGLQHMISFYKACFSGCHLRLTDEPSGRQRSSSGGSGTLSSSQRDAQDSLVAELKKVLANAQTYLLEKSKAPFKSGDDLSCYFDRNLAKFFLLN
ncbi:hypothetical protein NA57DRAFT_75876 [Rhizodiscina lignyota]|uniref:Zn(2)-C6 fungal-type domain-containing protein n=1 Tax=Rhizodiscina lignyota TaxID=1504668 RepID=A0A9P4M5Y4_9PEZI|nr:hypothetical protein NA57DRAFT_75876 [Rhizodiscina lignyota]